MKSFSFSFLIVFRMLGVTIAQQLEPIDSNFINSLPNFSRNIEKINDSFWPDMKIGPYCLYNIKYLDTLQTETNN
jgi:hypothetical protein